MPVDSKFFDKINDAQWTWYQTQIMLDEQDKYELLRDVAEHNAMFTNQEGVQQVRDARDHSFQTPDSEFKDLIQTAFGRDAGELGSNARPLSEEDIRGTVRKDLDPYLDLDLDEILFIPYEYEQ